MSYSRFLSFNVFGGIGWVLLMTVLGYKLGSVPFIRAHFEKVILGIIFVSVLPVLFEVWKQLREPRPPPAARIEPARAATAGLSISQ